MGKRYITFILCLGLLFTGCAVGDAPKTTDGRPIIGICLPDKRWEAEGKLLSQPLAAAGYRVELEYANADPQIQQMQVDSLLSRSVDCLIICAIDGLALSEPLQRAKEANIPVLAYDRMLMHSEAVSACVALDTETAGAQLGRYILDTVKPDTPETPVTIEFFMGAPEDNNAFLFHKGLLSVLQPALESGKLNVLSGRTSFEDTCVQNADPNTARSYLLDYCLDYYNEGLPEIICTGSIGMAKQCADTFPTEEEGAPPMVVGVGEKDSTEPFAAYAFFDRELLAKTCAQWALKLLQDPASLPNETTQNNGTIDVPTFLLSPEIVK